MAPRSASPKRTKRDQSYPSQQYYAPFLLFYARKFSITVFCCSAVGKTGRPVVSGSAGGLEPTHHPFKHSIPLAHIGCPRPQRGAFGLPINPSFGTRRTLKNIINKKDNIAKTEFILAISSLILLTNNNRGSPTIIC